MARTAGIPLVDLFDLTSRINEALPQPIQDFIKRFNATNHQVTRSPGAIFHYGTLSPLSQGVDAVPTEFNIGIGKLTLPLVNGGIPFQLGFPRLLPGNADGDLEAVSDQWALDLFLDRFSLSVDGLRPAICVAETGTAPRHLLRDPNRNEVKITGSAVLRIEHTNAGYEYRFIDQPDPLQPLALSGAVATLSFSPPHFFIGGSEFGLSVGRLQFDFSESYSPPNVLERNQGPAWTGLAIREATLYAPRNLPGLGDLSGGVKNLLLGSPVGVQGELEIQFGRTALNPDTFQFKQVTDEGNQALAQSGSGEQRLITIEGGEDRDASIFAGFTAPAAPTDGTIQDWKARWTWSDGSSDEGDSSSGAVRHGQTLRVTPIEVIIVDGTETEFQHPEITFRFVTSGTAPAVAATIGGNSFANLVHLGGTADEINGITLTASTTAAGTSSYEWQVEGRPDRTQGETFTLDVRGLSGDQFVVVRQTVTAANGDKLLERKTRVRLQIIEEGKLLVGCENGVFDAQDSTHALDLSAVEETFDLSDFHAEGEFNAKLEQAQLNSAVPPKVEVPDDGLALVTIASGDEPVVIRDRHVQILMDFDTPNEMSWGEWRPKGTTQAFSQSDLLAWANRYPGAQFLVIGRCGDLGSASYNTQLAFDRAARGRELLTVLDAGQRGSVIASAQVLSRGEQSAWSGSSAQGNALEETLADDGVTALLLAGEKSEAVGNAGQANGWLIRANEDITGWPTTRDETHYCENIRVGYRRVDIYAIGGAPTDDTIVFSDEDTLGENLRRSLVPADGRETKPAPSGSSKMDYRVKLRIVWDSPTVSEIQDAIPTLAEAEFAWTPQQMPLPEVDGEQVELSRETLTVFANWTYDTRTGYTKASLGIKSEGDPKGLVATNNKQLTAALAFGPMLLSGVNSETEVINSGARVAALLSAVGFADSLIVDNSGVALISAALETEMRSISDPGPDLQMRVITDYVCTLHVDAGVLGLKTDPDKPMKIRYKKVGIEYDTSEEGWSRFGLAYDSSSMEIEDPGRWQIDGTLGKMLRIVEVTVGRGSIWFEGRIAVALNLGIVEISEAIIRLTWHDGDPVPEFELRGLTLKVDVPNTIKGKGQIKIEDGGTIRAAVEAAIIPLGLGAQAGLGLSKPDEIAPSVFLELFLGVQFATPLPLANSGMAIYGFKGLFVMNGERKLPANPDPVGRELEWWQAPPGFKYQPKEGQYALGIGTVVGTMPDVSFCFSCAGMLVIGFPDPEVIFGVDATLIEIPDTSAKDEGGATGTITGLIVIDEHAVKVGISGQYSIPKLLEVKVPFSAYFPYANPEKSYVRIGSDGQTAQGRYGEPVTLRLLPDTLDVRAWTYLMVEGDGLHKLGGDDRFSFDGFAVGFGAGWDIRWSAGPIKLNAYAKLLVGLGTNPMVVKGGVFVGGKLDLVVLSIAAKGELILALREDYVRLEGKFCGEVDCFFFSIKGCVGVAIGSEQPFTPLVPDSPVRGISLTDRRDRIMGVATKGTPQPEALFPIGDPGNGPGVEANNYVWPDTAPIIHFSHYVENAMGAAAQFTPGNAPTQPVWSGSSELKYTYRLNSIFLRRRDDHALVTGDNPLDSTWTTSPYRQPDSSASNNPAPSEHEGPNLKLLDWNAFTWVVNLDDGGEGSAGDPATTIENLCDPPPLPRPACLFGRAARHAGYWRVRIRQEEPAPGPYPSRFLLTGEPVLRSGQARITGRMLQTYVQAMGGDLLPGGIESLPFSATLGSTQLQRGYRLPLARFIRPDGQIDVAFPWEARFDRQVTAPSVTLMVCDAPTQRTGEVPQCIDFQGLSIDQSLPVLNHQGVTIRPLNRQATLKVSDRVWQADDPIRPGRDGQAEIQLPGDGVEIRFSHPCARVILHLMQFKSAHIKAQALAADNRMVDAANTPDSVGTPVVLDFRGDEQGDINRVQLAGGDGEAVLYRICCVEDEAESAPEPVSGCEDFRALKPSAERVAKLSHQGFTFSVIDRQDRLRLSDEVDQSKGTPRAGRDKGAEIMFPSRGMRVKLPKACDLVELHLMLFANGRVSAIGLDAQGKQVAAAVSSTTQRQGHTLRLDSRGAAIEQVLLTGGSGEAVLYRICCPQQQAQKRCIDFAGVAATPRRKPVVQLVHKGVTFNTLNGEKQLSLITQTESVIPRPIPGMASSPSLLFLDGGLRISLSAPCDEISLKVTLLNGERISAQAMDSTGVRVARTISKAKVGKSTLFRLKGDDIRRIELVGAKQALLSEICCTVEAVKPGRPLGGGSIAMSADHSLYRSLTHISTHMEAADVDRPVRVNGIVGDELADGWRGELVEASADGRCSLLTFTPDNPNAGPWDGFRVLSPPGKQVTLVGVCGIDQRAVDARNDDIAARDEIKNDINEATLSEPEMRREIVLEPDTEYEIVIDWSWQAWQPGNAGESPPEPVPNSWQPGSIETYRFRTAKDESLAGTPQDGLNEHIFDARDVGRYLLAVEPADGRGVQFTGDPIWVHFDNGHVEQLLDQYDRTLEIEIRRTDPPPQASPASLADLLAALPVTTSWTALPVQMQPVGYQRIHAALDRIPCLPGGSPFGGVSLAAEALLDPDADYDLRVIAAGANDRPVVYASRFHTSRYSGPRALLDGLGYTHSVSPYLPDDLLMPEGSALPGSSLVESDSALESALAAIDADTLPLPTRKAHSYLIWRFDATQGWLIEGLLIDSLESMKREHTVVPAGSNQPTEGTRCRLSHAVIGDTRFDPVVANANWTRVLLKPPAAVSLPGNLDLPMQLNFATNEGSMSGFRRIRGLPSVIEREGL